MLKLPTDFLKLALSVVFASLVVYSISYFSYNPLYKDLDETCANIKKLEDFNEYKPYILSFQKNETEEKLKDYYLNFGSDKALNTESYIVYQPKQTSILYLSKVFDNPEGGLELDTKTALDERIDYGFKSTNTNTICVLLEDSRKTENYEGFTNRMFELYRTP